MLSDRQTAEDAASILMVYKALEEGLEKVSKHLVEAQQASPIDKFIYVADGRFRIHFTQ